MKKPLKIRKHLTLNINFVQINQKEVLNQTMDHVKTRKEK